jgi:hypothetical protein
VLELNGTIDDIETLTGELVVIDEPGITLAQHRTLRHLIHFVDEGPGGGFISGAFKEVVGGLFPTKITWYESSAKLKKIVETEIERSAGPATKLKPTPIKWTVYDTDGSTALVEISDAVTYVGASETTRLRTITEF